MEAELKELRALLSQLRIEQDLQERIDSLERELAVSPKEILVEKTNDPHLELLRSRIKELEEENYKLKRQLMRIEEELS